MCRGVKFTNELLLQVTVLLMHMIKYYAELKGCSGNG